MKRCPKCENEFPDDANFCPVDAGQLVVVETSAPPTFRSVDTGGHELLVGRFGVGDVVGGHRTGTVHAAVDKQGSTAIVKFVAPQVFTTALLLQRTERELSQLQTLSHQNVAKILGYGRRGVGLWIAMERIDGIPLSDVLAQRGRFSEQRAISVLRQVASGLEAASQLGVVHRDLATKNILLGPNDHVHIINFGVAVPAPADSKLRFQGVAEFIAPEQIDGAPVDQRCNIYSLGVIGYALVTGNPPFSGTVDEVVRGHLTQAIPPVGAEGTVSSTLTNVLLKALSKTSKKRYMTFRQFLDELDRGASDTLDMAGKTSASKPGKVQGVSSLNTASTNKTLMGMSIDVEKLIKAQKAAQGTEPGIPNPGHEPPAMVTEDQARVGAAGGKSARRAQTADPGQTKGKFRETMWFKKGELDQAAAEAAARAKPTDNVSSKSDEMEMDVRYSDDGTITEQDQERLSLRTGATMMMEAVPPSKVASFSEADLVSEMTGGRTKNLIIAGLVLLVVAAVVVIFAAT